MGADLSFKLDATEFIDQMDSAARNTVNAIRRAVDRTARTARKSAIAEMAADIGRPKSAFAKAVPRVKATTQASLTAAWTIGKQNIGILGTGTFTPGRSALQGSFQGSTFRITGGGSAALNIAKAFIVNSNGGRVLMVRTGAGKRDYRPVYAEMPSTGMRQEDGAPRMTWRKTAERDLAANAATEMQAALDGAQLTPLITEI